MFDDVQGLPQQRATRLEALVRQCQPLLEQDDGMDAVQRLLSELGTSTLEAIRVTRELLGAGPGDLADAQRIVLSHPARTEGLRTQQQRTDMLQRAKDVADAVGNLSGTRRSSTKLVAIDGAGGSGKTTLATAVADLLDGAVIIYGDDFYRPMPETEREQLDAQQGYERYFDWERLRDQVLAPLRDDEPTRYQAYDWTSGRLGAWHEVTAGTAVIVEGVYSSRPRLAPYYHLTVYVDTPRETCLRRLRARGQNPEVWITRWRAAEDYYLSATWPQTRAQLLVRGH